MLEHGGRKWETMNFLGGALCKIGLVKFHRMSSVGCCTVYCSPGSSIILVQSEVRKDAYNAQMPNKIHQTLPTNDGIKY